MTSPTAALSRNQKEVHLLAALSRLPAEHREALRLRYIEGLPSKEIASRLGKTDGAIRVLLTRSLGQLQKLLGPENAPRSRERREESKKPGSSSRFSAENRVFGGAGKKLLRPL